MNDDTQVNQPVAQAQSEVIVTDGGVSQVKQIGKYKVEVLRDKCISAGSCEAIAPGVFKLDEEGIATVINQNGGTDEEKLLAAQSCPTNAIIVTDTTTGQQVWPKA